MHFSESPKDIKLLFQRYSQSVAKGDCNLAKQLAEEVMMATNTEAPSNESLYEFSLASADDLAEHGNWPEAEAHYLLAVHLSDSPIKQLKARESLSAVYILIGRKGDALAQMQLAAQSAKDFRSRVIMITALQGVCRRALDCHDLDTAREAVQEAKAAIAADPKFRLLMSRNLICSAAYNLVVKDVDSAERELQSASELLMDMDAVEHNARIGYQRALANWWTVKANLSKHSGQFQESAKECKIAVDFCNHICQLPQVQGLSARVELVWALTKLKVSLEDMGEHSAAESALIEVTRVLAPMGVSPLTLG